MSEQGNNSRLHKFIDIETLMQLKNYDLRAKIVVESFLNGLHRSPYHGYSSRFSEYKPYVEGDDLRYLDWKLYARSDRYYIRKYEGETNVKCHMLLDLSLSMEFNYIGWSKADYACTLAATLAYFIYGQRDSFGLMSFDDDILEYLPAKSRRGHLNHFLAALEKRGKSEQSKIAGALKQSSELFRQRGLLVIISDMMMDLDELETQLGYLRAAGHEVILFQVLDPLELNMDLEKPALFEDMENGEKIFVNPSVIREDYQAKMKEHNSELQEICEKTGILYHPMTTDVPLNLALGDFLRFREKVSR